MKTLLAFASILIGLSACITTDDSDYKEMASEMCDCFNDTTKGLSEGGKRTIENSGKNDVDAQEAMMDYAQENVIVGMQDIHVLNRLKESSFKSCIKDLKLRHQDLYISGSDSEVQKNLIKVMKKIHGCELTYAILKSEM